MLDEFEVFKLALQSNNRINAVLLLVRFSALLD